MIEKILAFVIVCLVCCALVGVVIRVFRLAGRPKEATFVGAVAVHLIPAIMATLLGFLFGAPDPVVLLGFGGSTYAPFTLKAAAAGAGHLLMFHAITVGIPFILLTCLGAVAGLMWAKVLGKGLASTRVGRFLATIAMPLLVFAALLLLFATLAHHSQK